MPKTQPKGVIFDLDGTLVDSLSITFDAFNHAIVQFGGRMHTPAEIVRYFGASEKVILGKILGEEHAEAANRVCVDFMKERISQVRLHDGVSEVLSALTSRRIPFSLFTGRGWESAESILDRHGIKSHFITLIANEHVSAPKPSPEGVFLAASRMKLDPNDLIFVGDHPMDVASAQGAGAIGIAALWDARAERSHFAHLPDAHFIEKPAQILEYFRSPG